MEIGLTVVAEAIFAATRGVSTTHDAILVSLISSITVLISHTFVGIYGFLWGARPTESHPYVITDPI